MRTDEEGNPCPSTLGEYRALCAALMPESAAVKFLDGLITEQGADMQVIASDSQMRMLLFPMMLQPAEEERHGGTGD